MFPVARDVFFPISSLNNWLNGCHMPASHPWGMPPRVNIRRVDGGYSIELMAPGFSKENFSLELKGDELVISASCEECGKECKEGACDEGYIRREFARAAFEKRFTLPDRVDSAAISASYADGILTVQVPMRAESPEEEARSIPIQ